MKRHWPVLILVLISGYGIAQPPATQRDPVLDQEKAIAAKVEASRTSATLNCVQRRPRSESMRVRRCRLTTTERGMWSTRSIGRKCLRPSRQHLISGRPTRGRISGRQLFQDMFYRFFFVHELGHWMQDQILNQRHDAKAETAKKNADTARWQYEIVANRISVAWWREHDQAYLTKLVNDFRKIQRQLPIPVPQEKTPEHFLPVSTTNLRRIRMPTVGFNFR